MHVELGTLVKGVVDRRVPGGVAINLESPKTAALLPTDEWLEDAEGRIEFNEYEPGSVIWALVQQANAPGPHPIVLERRSDDLVRSLFSHFVPEIGAGIVKIERVARAPGRLTLIAPSSNNRDIEALGACIGMRGARHKAVVAALGGESVEMVSGYGMLDTNGFVFNALPFPLTKVLVDEERHLMHLTTDAKLRWGVGEHVRLASDLTGWSFEVNGGVIKVMKVAQANADIRAMDQKVEKMRQQAKTRQQRMKDARYAIELEGIFIRDLRMTSSGNAQSGTSVTLTGFAAMGTDKTKAGRIAGRFFDDVDNSLIVE